MIAAPPDIHVPPGKKLIRRYRPKVKVLEPQHRFLTSQAKYDGYIGGRGAGKSYAGCLKARAHAMARSCTGCVITPTYPMMRDIIWPVWTKLFRGYFKNPKRPINKSDKISELRNGSTVIFRSADNPDNLRGPNLSWFWIDEAALLDLYVWRVLIPTLREGGRPGRAWITTTPRGKDWLYKKFVVDENPKYSLVHATTFDNYLLDQETRDDIAEEYGVGWFGRQELYGEFTEPEGTIFKREWFDFVEPTALPEFKVIARGWDLATTTKTTSDFTVGVKVGITNDEELYILDVVRGQWEWPDGKQVIIKTAHKDSVHCQVMVEAVAFQRIAQQELQREPAMANYMVNPVETYRDKLTYALPIASRAKAGKVHLVRAPWNDAYLDELCLFDGQDGKGKKHDDQVDATTIAIREFIRNVEARITII